MDKSRRVLLIGGGGREHALAWKLAQSPSVESIIAVPGNGGTAALPKTRNIDLPSSPADYPQLVQFARENDINLVDPGPDQHLVDGIVDVFKNAGIPCFGPSKWAAQLEGSKAFSKDFMRDNEIPTARYENFTDYSKALEYVDGIDHDVVIKAGGLAAGKGVIMPTTKDEAKLALKQIMQDKAFGSAGDEVVVEEFLEGDELSVLTFCDGYSFKSLPMAQDHKRIFDGDRGPNTGGMGCYAPTMLATKELSARVDTEILAPTFAAMRQAGHPFRGVLFTGLMITSSGPKVLEYNVRFGDPETQTLLPLLSQDTDLAEVMMACIDGYLGARKLASTNKFSATVVLAAKGYPDSYAKGTPMVVKEAPAGSIFFHAGTAGTGDQLKTSGGRVIAINSTADSLREAVDAAYAVLASDAIHFEGMYFRKDIAHRAFRTAAPKESMTYAQAGVDIQAGNDFVQKIKAAVKSTARPGADALIGGFGGELDLATANLGFPSDSPVLVAAIDGVGTKLMVAQALKKHDTVGIDLVAMNVNDLIAQGATPLMFLDYFGCSKLDLATASDFVGGVAEGCRQAGCALVGGETAEMPGMYQAEDYDAAGCAIGTMTKAARLPQLDKMREGDVLLGLASTGVHSNGFSLVRRILAASGLEYTSPCPWNPSVAIGHELLTPTRIYIKSLLPSLGQIKGLAHITGGGLVENIPRMLPSHLAADVAMGSWPLLPVFAWLRREGNVIAEEMVRAFNCGVGMVAVVSEEHADAVAKDIAARGEKVYRIGKLVKRAEGSESCICNGLDHW